MNTTLPHIAIPDFWSLLIYLKGQGVNKRCLAIATQNSVDSENRNASFLIIVLQYFFPFSVFKETENGKAISASHIFTENDIERYCLMAKDLNEFFILDFSRKNKNASIVLGKEYSS